MATAVIALAVCILLMKAWNSVKTTQQQYPRVVAGFWLFLLLQVTVQCFSLVRADQIWADEVARRMLLGGNYAHNFFENNPPLIFFLHVATRLLASGLHCPPLLVWHSLVCLLSVVSFFGVMALLRQSLNDTMLIAAYGMALIVVYGVIPYINFGQREQVMLALSLPYFFTKLAWCYQGPPSMGWRVVIGVAAGIGLALKPYFFAPVVLLELAQLVLSPRRWWCHAQDFVALVAVNLLYLLSIAWLTPDYYAVILPLAVKVYAAFVNLPLLVMLTAYPFLFIDTLLLVALYLLRHPGPYRLALMHGILLCIGFSITFLSQHKGFDYHAMPMLAAALLLLAPVLVSLQGLQQASPRSVVYSVMGGMLLMLSMVPGLRSIPGMVVNNLICRYHPYCNANLVRLIHQQHPQLQRFYALSYQLHLIMVNSYTSGIPHPSRFPSNWLVSKLAQIPKDSALRGWVRGMLVDDFLTQKPDLVLDDRCQGQRFGVGSATFNQLALLMEDSRFRKAWADYRPIAHGNPHYRCIQAHLLNRVP